MRVLAGLALDRRLTRTGAALLAVGLVVAMMAPGVGNAAPSADSRSLAQGLWRIRYNGPGNGADSAKALGASPDGSKVFATGQSDGGASGDDYATVAYDAATGAQLWVARYNGPGNGTDVANALGVSPDGSTVFATGQSDGGASGDDYATVAYDAATGAQLWATRYKGPGNNNDVARALVVSPDGSTVFATGYSFGGASDFDYATVAYDAATGAQLWVTRFNGPGNRYDYAYALGVSPDGSKVFATGQSDGGASGDDYATVAYDAATGAQLWASRYNGQANDSDGASALGVSPDGSTVFATGVSWGGSTGFDYATVAYDAATGAELWTARYNGPGNDSDQVSALGVSPDGFTVFASGYSWGGSTEFDYATLAYDAAAGAQLWATRYNGPGNGDDIGNALGVSPDGSTAFVTGSSVGAASGNDYATVAYDANTGAQLGALRTRAQGSDVAIALAVHPSGFSVFVTGGIQTKADGRTDYATIAYAT